MGWGGLGTFTDELSVRAQGWGAPSLFAELSTNSGWQSRRSTGTFTEHLLYALTYSTCRTTLEGTSRAVQMGRLSLRAVKTLAQG